MNPGSYGYCPGECDEILRCDWGDLGGRHGVGAAYRRHLKLSRTDMQSQLVCRFAYDEVAHVVEVLFVNGKLHRYHDVPVEVGKALARTPAKGAYIIARLRDRYRVTRQDCGEFSLRLP